MASKNGGFDISTAQSQVYALSLLLNELKMLCQKRDNGRCHRLYVRQYLTFRLLIFGVGDG